jgi:hypothetical protein
MTRQEKNIAKSKTRKCLIHAWIFMGLFFIGLVSMVATLLFPSIEPYLKIVGPFSIGFMVIGFIFVMAGLYFEGVIVSYRADIKRKRNRNLVRIGIEAIQNKDWSKSESIFRMLSYDHRVFLKGFLLASYQASGDEKLFNKAQSILNNLYENL